MTGPAAASIGANELDFAAIGQGSVPERLEFGSGSWQLWQPLGGRSSEIPALVAPAGGAELLFLTAGDGGLWYGSLPAGASPSTSVKPAPRGIVAHGNVPF